MTDWFNRYTKAYALSRATGTVVAQAMLDFMTTFGCPLELYSNNGRNLHGSLVQSLCKYLGVTKLATVPYRPSSNGITERGNSTIKDMLSAFTNRRGSDWDQHLSTLMMAYTSSIHKTLGETPFAMMFGRRPRLPIDSLIGPPPEAEYQEVSPSQYVQTLTGALKDIHDTVAAHVGARYEYQAKTYDRNVKPQEFAVAQPVWLRVYPNVKGRSRSLLCHWDGPWIVVKQVSRAHYKIQKTPTGRTVIAHGDKLKPFHGEISDNATKRLWLALQPGADKVSRLAVEPGLVPW